jgi:hypothetical protein
MIVKLILKASIVLLLCVYVIESIDTFDDRIIDTITQLNNASIITFRKQFL